MWQVKLGTCIYVSPSGYKVYQNIFYRWLTLGSSALQTVINKRQPQNPVLHYLSALSLMAREVPDDCCLLGLGGGGIPHLLASCSPNHSITAVDNDAEVIQIAKQFFMVDRIQNLSIVHQNAMDFVKDCRLSFNHLIVDLYGANHFPTECNNDEFFINCKKILGESGFLAVNVANSKEQLPLLQLIKKQFKSTLVIPIKKCANVVIIASKNENYALFIKAIRETGAIKKIVWIKSWGYVGE